MNFGSLNESETTFLSSHDEPPRTLPESCLEQASPIPVDAWERMSASIAALQAEHAIQVGVDEALADRDGVDAADAQHQVDRQLARRARQGFERVRHHFDRPGLVAVHADCWLLAMSVPSHPGTSPQPLARPRLL